jgi:hypothetical protein
MRTTTPIMPLLPHCVGVRVRHCCRTGGCFAGKRKHAAFADPLGAVLQQNSR